MPVVICPECSSQVSTTLSACPHCGFALGKSQREPPDAAHVQEIVEGMLGKRPAQKEKHLDSPEERKESKKYHNPQESRAELKELFDRAGSYADLRDYHKAIEYYTEALGVDPEYVPCMHSRGICYLNIGECDQAISDFTEVLRRRDYPKTELASVWLLRGKANAMKGDYDQAIEDASESLRLRPHDKKALIFRSLTYGKLERTATSSFHVEIYRFLKEADYEEIDQLG